jgi:hypothetical protein
MPFIIKYYRINGVQSMMFGPFWPLFDPFWQIQIRVPQPTEMRL